MNLYLLQGDYVFGSICLFLLFLCLSFCLSLAILLRKLWIAIKFHGGVWGGKRNESLNFGGDPDHLADCPIRIQPLLNNLML